MEYAAGALLALGVGATATLVGFDRDRSFYPVVLVVIASYYALFAVMAGSGAALGIEALVLGLALVIAVIGFRTNLWLVVVALAAHGVLDLVHHDLVANPGVPGWWPGFCLAFDVVAAGYLAVRLLPSSHPNVDAELRLAAACAERGETALAFHHLERAHVLGQSSTLHHVRVHAHMFRWGLRARQPREVLGQLLRMAGAATKTAFGLVPLGNTGGSNVSPFRPLPVPDDLAALMSPAPRRGFSAAVSAALLSGATFGR